MKTLEIKIPSRTYLVIDLRDNITNVNIYKGRWVFVGDNFSGSYPLLKIPSGNWQPICFGKDHPELVEKLGLLSENQIAAVEDSPIIKAMWQQAQKRVFKNPFILEKQ